MSDQNTPAVDVSTEAVMRLLDGVTPGPWAVDEGQDYCDVVTDYGVFGEDFIICEHASRDASFIAASRDLVPALLADRDRLADEVARLTAGLSLWIDRAEAAEAEVARLREALIELRDLTCEAIEDDDGNSGCGQCADDCTGCIAHAALRKGGAA